MKKKLLFSLKTLCICFLFSKFFLYQENAFASSIEVPEEELARETVLPKFDIMESVKSRNIVTEKKIELGCYYGWNITDPIYNQSKLGLNLGYHSSELSAFVLNIAMWSSGVNTQYTDSLSIVSSDRLDFTRIPKKTMSIFGHYEYKSYYGKISFTKKGILNMSIFPLLGLGVTQFEHKTYPGMDGGIGIKFYFSNYFALRMDMKAQVSQTVNPFLKGGLVMTSKAPKPSEFKDKLSIDTILDVGFTFLF